MHHMIEAVGLGEEVVISSYQELRMISNDSSTCLLVMTSGGEKRMMFRWVGLAISPFFNRIFENLSA